MAQSQIALCIIQVVSSQVGFQLSAQRGALPLVGQMQGLRVISLYVSLQFDAVESFVVQVLVGQLCLNLCLDVRVVNIKVACD